MNSLQMQSVISLSKHRHTKASALNQIVHNILHGKKNDDYTVRVKRESVNVLPPSRNIRIKPKESLIKSETSSVVEYRQAGNTSVSIKVTEPSINESQEAMPSYGLRWIKGQNKKKLIDQYDSLLAVKTDQQVITQIEKDLNRTIKVTPNNQNKIKNILLAFANYDPQIGYVQGINYIASVLYSHYKSEWFAFWLLVHIIESLEIRDLLIITQNSLTKYCVVFEFLVFKYLPHLNKHFQTHGINVQLFLQQWLLSLLLQFIPYKYAGRFLEGLFKEGITQLFTIMINILQMLSKQLQQLDQIEMLMLLTSKQYQSLNWDLLLNIRTIDLSKNFISYVFDSFDAEQNQFTKERLLKQQLTNSIEQFFKFID